jgi:hypothetical protein
LKAQEFVTIHAALTTCRQSEREPRVLLDKETYEMLFNAAVICKGVGGGKHIDTGGPQRGFNVKEKKRGNTI